MRQNHQTHLIYRQFIVKYSNGRHEETIVPTLEQTRRYTEHFVGTKKEGSRKQDGGQSRPLSLDQNDKVLYLYQRYCSYTEMVC